MTEKAAQHVCGFDTDIDAVDVRERFWLLTSHSLVVQEEMTDGDAFCYRLLEPLREFAEGNLRPDEREEVRRRHGTYFLAMAQNIEPSLAGSGQGNGLAALAAEYENFQSALLWAASNEPRAIGLPLAIALHRYWEARGPQSEGYTWLIALLGYAGTPDLLRARGISVACALGMRLGKNEELVPLLHEGIVLLRSLGDDFWLAKTLTVLGHLVAGPGRRASHEEALSLWTKLGSQEGMAFSFNSLGNLALIDGRRAEASALYQRSLKIKRQIGSRLAMTNTLHNLGDMALEDGQPKRALAFYKESLSIAEGLHSAGTIVHALDYLGEVAYYRGDMEGAISYFERSWMGWRVLKDQVLIPLPLLGLAMVHYRRGDLAKMHTFLRQSLQGAIGNQDKRGLRIALTAFALYTEKTEGVKKAGLLLSAAEALEVGLRPAYVPDYRALRARLEMAEALSRFPEGQGRGMTFNDALALAMRIV